MDLKKLVNKGIDGLSPYEPGKPIEDLERELGIKNAVKLASNENPVGPSPKIIDSIEKIVKETHRYLTVMQPVSKLRLQINSMCLKIK